MSENTGNSSETAGTPENQNANTAEIKEVKTALEKIGGVVSKIADKVFGEKKEEPPKEDDLPTPPKDDADANDKYLEEYKKRLAAEAQIKEFETKEAERKLAEEKAEKKRQFDRIENDIRELVANRVIAADDKAKIERWRKLFNADYESTKENADEAIKAMKDSEGGSVVIQKKTELRNIKQQAADAYLEWRKPAKNKL